jgi:hypothetical protein
MTDTPDHLARHTEAVRQLDRAIERIMGIETVPMGGDNLAVLLCSHFDDPDDGSEPDDNGWSQSATDAYDEVKQEIAGLFVPVRIAIAAMLPAILSQFDEDWFWEVITDSIDMDWAPRDAARLIVSRMKEELGQ